MSDLMQIIGRASEDEAFKAELMGNPKAVLDRAGVAVPAGATVTVHANDASTFHAALPTPQDEKTLAFVREANPLAAKVFERAWSDPGFKQRLMTSPRQAFVEATGVTPPATLKLVAHENTPQAVHLVIPHVPTSGELSDTDLEQVAGGKAMLGAYAPGQQIPTAPDSPFRPGGPCLGGGPVHGGDTGIVFYANAAQVSTSALK